MIFVESVCVCFTLNYFERNSRTFGLSVDICARKPIPVAARSKTWICCRSFAGIAGSNPAGGVDICVL